VIYQKQGENKGEMSRNDWIFLVLIFAGAILFRILLLTKASAVGFDEVNYLKLAASGRLNGLNHVLHAYWTPLYPLIVALFSYIVPDFEAAGRWLQILLATTIMFPLFFFVKKYYGKPVAFGTILLIAFFTFSARFSIKAETEFVYSFAAILGILLGWHVLKTQSIFKSAGVGLLFGASYLARPEGIGFYLVFAGIVLLVLLHQLFSRKNILSSILILIVSGAGCATMALPYIVYVHQETGLWTISTKGTVNQQGAMYVKNMAQYAENPFHVVNEDNTILLQDEIYHTGTFVKTTHEQGAPVVEIEIKELAHKVFENLYSLITKEMTGVLTVPILLLLGLGLFYNPWPKDSVWINLYLLSFIAFFWFGLIPVFHITLRYFVPLLPISFIWIASGAIHLIGWGEETLKNAFPKWPGWPSTRLVSLALVVMLVLGGAVLPELGKRMSKSEFSADEWAPAIEQKKAGLWLKEQGMQHPIIMAYNHAVSFYAGNYEIKESIEIPENKIDRVIAYAKNRGAKYLVLDDRYKHYHPLIADIYEQKNVPSELKLIYFDKMKNGIKTLIYEIEETQE
jgi:hypothetical protein